MTRHPRFYLPAEIVKAIALSSRRWPDGRSLETSRSRGMAQHSVICDPVTARQIIEQIEAAAAKSRDSHFRERCTASCETIRQAIIAAAAPAVSTARVASDRERGILGL